MSVRSIYDEKLRPNFTKHNLNLNITIKMSSPRRPTIHNFPNQPCPQGYYRWNNGFSSGCKSAQEDRRSLALQFRGVRGSMSPRQIQADGVSSNVEVTNNDRRDLLRWYDIERPKIMRQYPSISGIGATELSYLTGYVTLIPINPNDPLTNEVNVVRDSLNHWFGENNKIGVEVRR
jgi:hypothetical protein